MERSAAVARLGGGVRAGERELLTKECFGLDVFERVGDERGGSGGREAVLGVLFRFADGAIVIAAYPRPTGEPR